MDIINIKAYRQNGFIWLSFSLSFSSSLFLDICPSRPSLEAVPQDGTLYLQSWWIEVRTSRPTLVCPYVGVHLRM